MRRRRGSARRGFTIIDAMVGLSILGIAMSVMLQGQSSLTKHARKAIAEEGIVRIMDAEFERAHACDTARCVQRLETRTPVVVETSWGRVMLRRKVRPGPAGTLRLELHASSSHLLRARSASALVRP